jgi:hypothetical protein
MNPFEISGKTKRKIDATSMVSATEIWEADMPGPVLHEGCLMKCDKCPTFIHVTAPQNQILRVNGRRALVREDLFELTPPSMCPFLQQGTPCTAVHWEDASVSPTLRVGDLHVLLQEGNGGVIGVGAPDRITKEQGRVEIVASPGPHLRQM